MPNFYTLYLVILLLNLSHCIIWGLIVHRYRELTAARYWLSGSAVSVAGGISLSLQGNTGEFSLTVAGNSFIVLGFYLNWLGLLLFHRSKVRWRTLITMVAVSILVMLMTFHPWYGHNPLYTVAQAIPLALSAIYLLRHHRRELGAVVASMAMVAGCISHGVIASGNVLILAGITPDLQLIHAAAIDLIVFVFAGVVWNFGFLLSAVDRLREDVERLANEDSLTGLANRRLFMRSLSALCEQADHSGSFSLLLFDLDRFKPINDKYGHSTGDAALRHAANVISTQLLQNEVFARLGGDEFGLLLTNRTSNEAALIAARITRALSTTPLQHGNVLLHLTASIGIASSEQDGRDPATLLEQADHALYLTKRRGRNGYSVSAALPKARDQIVQLDSVTASANSALG